MKSNTSPRIRVVTRPNHNSRRLTVANIISNAFPIMLGGFLTILGSYLTLAYTSQKQLAEAEIQQRKDTTTNRLLVSEKIFVQYDQLRGAIQSQIFDNEPAIIDDAKFASLIFNAKLYLSKRIVEDLTDIQFDIERHNNAYRAVKRMRYYERDNQAIIYKQKVHDFLPQLRLKILSAQGNLSIAAFFPEADPIQYNDLDQNLP